MVWSGPFSRMRSARVRVGRMLSRRFTPLMVVQIRWAVLRASLSVSEAYRWKYDSGFLKAVSRSVRNRSTYQRWTWAGLAST